MRWFIILFMGPLWDGLMLTSYGPTVLASLYICLAHWIKAYFTHLTWTHIKGKNPRVSYDGVVRI